MTRTEKTKSLIAELKLLIASFRLQERAKLNTSLNTAYFHLTNMDNCLKAIKIDESPLVLKANFDAIDWQLEAADLFVLDCVGGPTKIAIKS